MQTNFDLGIRAQGIIAHSNSVHLDSVLLVQDGKVAGIARSAEVRRESCKEWQDIGDHWILPGLVNAHTHLAMNLLRGRGEDLPFADWLFGTIVPLEQKHVSADFVRVGTALGAWESLANGVTTVCDMYYFGTQMAEAAEATGIRSVVGQALLSFPTPDGTADDAFRNLDELCERFGTSEQIFPALATHAPYTVQDDLFARARDYALRKNLKIITHVSETKKENEDSLQQFGKTPVQRMHDLGVLEAKNCFAHGVWLTDADLDLCSAKKVGLVYNPESNMKLGAGAARVGEWIRRGISVGLGTDGAASNNDLNLFSEMDTGVKLQKLNQFEMTTKQIFDAVTIGGARALGLDSKIGSLEVGKFADFSVVFFSGVSSFGMQNPFVQMVYCPQSVQVLETFVSGKSVCKDGRLTGLDTEKLRHDADGWFKSL